MEWSGTAWNGMKLVGVERPIQRKSSHNLTPYMALVIFVVDICIDGIVTSSLLSFLDAYYAIVCVCVCLYACVCGCVLTG